MYSMEKLARGIIRTPEQISRQERKLRECEKRVKNMNFDDLLYEKDCMGRKRPRRGYLVNVEKYEDRPRGQLYKSN